MNLKQYTLIGLIPSFLGCASVFYDRNSRANYKVICNSDAHLELPGISTYGVSFSSRQVCLESVDGEKITLTFHSRLRGKAKQLEKELSDVAVGDEIKISSKLVKDVQDDIFDGCTVAGFLSE